MKSQECGRCFVHHKVPTGCVLTLTHTWLSSKASMSLELFVIAVVTTMNLKPETRKHKR